MLRNKFTGPGKPYGETDSATLATAEAFYTALRLEELRAEPLAGPLDYDHMKAIHRHIFQDVYDWAGQERTAPTMTPMTKDGHAYFPAGPALTDRAEELFGALADKDELRGLPREQFVPELAEIWGELNVVHSFREGNTRAQFAFFHQLADQAGYRLDTEPFKIGGPLRDEFVKARFEHQDTTRADRLAAVLSRAIDGGRGPHQTRGWDTDPTPPTAPTGRVREQIQARARQLRDRHDDQPPSLGGPLHGRGPTR